MYWISICKLCDLKACLEKSGSTFLYCNIYHLRVGAMTKTTETLSIKLSTADLKLILIVV